MTPISNAGYLEGIALYVLVISCVSMFCGVGLQVVVNLLSTLVPSNNSITVNMFLSCNILVLLFLIFSPGYGKVKDFFMSYALGAVLVFILLDLVFGYLSIKDGNPSNLSYFQAVLNTTPYMAVLLSPTLLLLLYCLIRFMTWK